MTNKITKKRMNEIRDEINRWYDLMDDPSWDENTTAMWAMAEEIVRLRETVRLLKYSLEHQVCECSHCLDEEGAS